MSGRPVHLVLDTSAILGYASGALTVGEAIAGVADEGANFAVSVLCLAEAARLVSSEQAIGVNLLARHSCCVVLPVPVAEWQELAETARTLGRMDLAVSLTAASQFNAFVLTAEPDKYRLPGDDEPPAIDI